MDNKPQLLTFTEYRQQNAILIQMQCVKDRHLLHIDKCCMEMYRDYLNIIQAHPYYIGKSQELIEDLLLIQINAIKAPEDKNYQTKLKTFEGYIRAYNKQINPLPETIQEPTQEQLEWRCKPLSGLGELKLFRTYIFKECTETLNDLLLKEYEPTSISTLVSRSGRKSLELEEYIADKCGYSIIY